MDQIPKYSRLSLARESDPFHSEVQDFDRDVHLLILGTLSAAKAYLYTALEKDVSAIDTRLEQASGEYAEHLYDQRAELMGYQFDQERFVRNMALVALSSRLIHALNEMAENATGFRPRKSRYGGKRMSDFQRLWLEYFERFAIDFTANSYRIAFTDSMNAVRNKIVHAGGLANKFRPLNEIPSWGNVDDLINRAFSIAHPQFVRGEGLWAEVTVNDDQLDEMVRKSIALVRWLAEELRRLQLADAAAEDTANPPLYRW
jgi:hypothetical protein